MEKKTSITIDEEVWKRIKISAVKSGKSIGEFIEMLYTNWEVKNNCSQLRNSSEKLR